MNQSSPTVRLLLLIGAVLAFLLGAVAAQQADGEVIVGAVCWLGIAGALFAGSHIP